jgi:dissimilatory sulfite reductase (desulfoviridin) alpha/beta subunit
MAWSERFHQNGGYIVLSVTPVDMRAMAEETRRRGAKVVENGDLFRPDTLASFTFMASRGDDSCAAFQRFSEP